MEKFRQLFRAMGVTFVEATDGQLRWLQVEDTNFMFDKRGNFLGTEPAGPGTKYTPRKAS